jgi:hypothetical protein
MKLAFLSGPRAGEELEVDKDLVVGREKADVEIEDSGVSRQHATFRPTGDGLEVEDMGSTNGTYVNGDKITGTKQLEPGDFVTIGGTTLEIRDDWRSAETQAIPTPVSASPETDDERYVSTSPIPAPATVDRPMNVRLLLIAGGVVGLILVLGLFFTLGGSDDGFAKEVDAVCAKARNSAADTELTGDNLKALKPAAQKLLKTRTKLRQDLAALEPEADQAQAFGAFLQRYATTNDQLERLASLDRKTKRAKVQGAVAKVRAAAEAELKAAQDMGLEVCGGLPV